LQNKSHVNKIIAHMQEKGILGKSYNVDEPSVYSKVYDSVDFQNLEFTEACDLQKIFEEILKK
jgi:hypothetical protein